MVHKRWRLLEKELQPDVVVLDAIMPEMDGFDTVPETEEKLPSTLFCYMTGLNDSEHVIHGFDEVGGVDYIHQTGLLPK